MLLNLGAKVKSSVQYIEESPSNLIIIDSEYEGNNVKGIQIKIIQGTHTHSICSTYVLRNLNKHIENTHTFNMFYIFAEKFKQTHREQTQR